MKEIYKEGLTFKISSKRSDHTFELDSRELNQTLGGAVFEAIPTIQAQMKKPDINLQVEIREEAAYISYETIKGAGGLPVGTSGKGLALQVKRLYPESVVEYETACKEGKFRVGDVLIAPTNDGKHIIHFPTKKTLENQSQYQYIEEGLDALHRLCLEIPNGAIIAIPQLGCGLG